MNSLHWGDGCFSPQTLFNPTLLSLRGRAILRDLSPCSQVHLTKKDCKSHFCACASDPQLELTLLSAVGNISDGRDKLVRPSWKSRWAEDEGGAKWGMIMTRPWPSCVTTRNFPQVTLARGLLTHLWVHCHTAGFLKSNLAFPPPSLLFVAEPAEKKDFLCCWFFKNYCVTLHSSLSTVLPNTFFSTLQVLFYHRLLAYFPMMAQHNKHLCSLLLCWRSSW